MKELHWNAFEKHIYIKTTVEKLYDLWSTKAGITKWFLRDAIFERKGKILADKENVRAGDTYVWSWHNWNGKEEGRILEANNKDELLLEFAKSKLSVQFKENNDIVILNLRQYDIPQDEESKLNIYCGCNHGWTFWLTNLKAYLEHGILLNETEHDLTKHELSHMTFVNM